MVLEREMNQSPLFMRQEMADYVDFLLYKYRTAKLVKPRAGCMKGTVISMSDDFKSISIAEEIPIVSSDAVFQDYPINCIWK